MKSVAVYLLLTIAAVAFADLVIPFQYPLYSQCDPRWGNDNMGKDVRTVCQSGCAMSSVSMALGGKNLTIDGEPSNPGALNKWLNGNDGYHCIDNICFNLVLDAPNRIAPGKVAFFAEQQKPPVETLKEWIDSTIIAAVAHVRNNSHFVLLVGYDSDDLNTLVVNDPFFPVKLYPYANITDIITYAMI